MVEDVSKMLLPCNVPLTCDTYDGFIVCKENTSKRLFQVGRLDGGAISHHLTMHHHHHQNAEAGTVSAAGAGGGTAGAAEGFSPEDHHDQHRSSGGGLMPVAGTTRGEGQRHCIASMISWAI